MDRILHKAVQLQINKVITTMVTRPSMTGVIVYQLGINRPGNTALEAIAIEWQKNSKNERAVLGDQVTPRD